jgi:hypothetical protein
MSRKVPLVLRLCVFAWVALLSLPHAVLPPPPFLECHAPPSSSHSGDSPARGKQGEASSLWLWPLRCDGHRLVVPPHWLLRCARDLLRPWHMPLIGALQAAVGHLSAFTPAGARCTRRAQSVTLLEWLVYVPAFQACVLMLLWVTARVPLSVLWTMAGHAALQFMWDGRRCMRRLPQAATEPHWLGAYLGLFALVEVPLLAYVSGGLLHNTPSLFATPNLGFFAGANLMGALLAELCSDAFAVFHPRIIQAAAAAGGCPHDHQE